MVFLSGDSCVGSSVVVVCGVGLVWGGVVVVYKWPR